MAGARATVQSSRSIISSSRSNLPGQASDHLDHFATPCKSTGYEQELSWYKQQTVDEQLANAEDRLIAAKAEKEVAEAGNLPNPPGGTTSVTAKGGSMTKARRKKIAEKAAAKMEALRKVKNIFIPDSDPRYEEMVRFVAKLPATEEKVHTSRRNPLGDSWLAEFRISLDMMLAQLSLTFDPKMGEEQLARIYEWFQTHRGGLEDRGRPASAGRAPEDLNFIEVEAGGEKRKSRPGSAFYVPPRDGDNDVLEEAEAEKETAAVVEDGSMASRLTNVQLPPARERLRTFETKQVVCPLSARRLKAAMGAREDCQSPEPTDRSFTPSTCTGGSRPTTARSTPTPLGPLSARSSPTPLGGSRPSSAAGSVRRPMTPQGGYSAEVPRPPQSARPNTAPRTGGARPPTLPMSARDARVEPSSSGLMVSAQQEYLFREALEREESEREMATAIQNMEERWLMRRHRDIANQMVDEDRHAAVAAWAERRARVEEEISYNAEAMRFNSALWQRATAMPADAEEDIAPTAPPGEEELRGSSPLQSPQAGSATRSTSPRRPPSRHDVSRITEDHQVRFSPECARRPHSPDPGRTDRIANLRRIHRHLLRASEAEEADFDDGDSDCVESIFQTEVGASHISLSAYTPDCTQATVAIRNRDDADIVAAVCDHWSGRELAHGITTEAGESLHELRFKQQQEAEAVKRLLAKRNCPFNAAVVDSALVMPPHVVKAENCVFNKEPNLKTEGMPSWYYQDRQKKKKPGKRAKAKASRRASRNP